MSDSVDTISRAAGPILRVLVIAVVAYVALCLVGRLVSRLLVKRLQRSGEDQITRTLSDVETKKRIAAIVVLLIVVAIVAKDVFRDYVGGFLIVLENQFAIGDWVRLGDQYGQVEAVGLRRTTLRNTDGDLVSIPNGQIGVAVNRTRDWGRLNLEIGIADPSQLGAAREAIDQAGRDLAADPATRSSVLEPPRFMFVTDISDAGVRILIWGRLRAGDRCDVAGAYRGRLLEALDAAGVELVTSQRLRLIDQAVRDPDEPADPRGSTTSTG